METESTPNAKRALDYFAYPAEYETPALITGYTDTHI